MLGSNSTELHHSQQQEMEEGELGWLGKKRNVSKSPGDEKSRIQLIVCGKCDGMKGDDVKRVGRGHGGLVEELECSGSQRGGPSARRSCSGHARYLAKDVLEGASGRKKKTLFLCEPTPRLQKSKHTRPASFNVHLERFLTRCPYFP